MPESRLIRLSVLGSTKVGSEEVQVVLRVPVPPERFNVMLPSSWPEQETLVAVPLEKIVLGSLMVKVVSLAQARLSTTDTV